MANNCEILSSMGEHSCDCCEQSARFHAVGIGGRQHRSNSAPIPPPPGKIGIHSAFGDRAINM